MTLPLVERLRRLRGPALLLLAAVVVVTVALLAGGAAPSRADDCVPEDPILQVSRNLPIDEECGIIDIENGAFEDYLALHGLQADDSRLRQAGAQKDIAGMVYSDIQAIATGMDEGSTDYSDDQKGAYDWLRDIVAAYEQGAAHQALVEYHAWSAAPCTYVPPNTTLYTFRGSLDAACTSTFGALLRGPKPPTYDEFLEYGLYDQSLQTPMQGIGSSASLWDQDIARDQINRAATAWTSLILAPGAGIISRVTPAARRLDLKLRPNLRSLEILKQKTNGAKVERMQRGEQEQNARNKGISTEDDLDVGLEDEVSLDGEALSDDALEAFPLMEETADEGGFSIADAVADTLLSSGAGMGFFVAGLFAEVLTNATIEIVRELQIPQQLQANIDKWNGTLDLGDLMTGSDGSPALVESIFEAQLDPDEFAVSDSVRHGTRQTASASTAAAEADDFEGLANAPYHGDQIQVTYDDNNGNALWTERDKTVLVRQWPIGIQQGAFGMPWGPIALDNGMLYRQATLDERDAGVSQGTWTPTTELDYFDWSHVEHIAYIDGDGFYDVLAPGTADLGGTDYHDCSAAETACQHVTTLFALGPGDEKLRLTLKPDLGTTALLNIENNLGGTAGNDLYGNGSGLVVGQTVHLIDELTSPNGLDTTYTWTVESRCAQGATCTPSTDAAFHGNPTVTLTGQDVHYTWPAPGTYHVRLTTTDEYGVTHTSDRDVTVVDTDPRIGVSTSPALNGAAFGPFRDGDTATVNGCLVTGAGGYGTPKVTLDWGDGDTASQQGTGTTDGLQVSYGTLSGCPSPWHFTATHDYSVSVTRQVPVTVTLDDGFGRTFTSRLGANLVYIAAPSFTAASSTTFTAGSTGHFVVTVAGAPNPTVTLTGTLPSGLGFDPTSWDTYVLSGDPNVDDGGVYPLTLHASSSAGSVDQALTLEVDSAPRITSDGSHQLVEGQSADLAVTAVGYPAPTVTLDGTLPAGLSFSGGHITGTPSAGSAGTYDLTAVATSSAGIAQQALTLQVGTAPAITSPSTAPFVIGSTSSFTIATSGYPTPTISMSGSLPSGLSFHDNGDGTATIFGAPASDATGTTVTLTASNAAGSGTQTLHVNASDTGGPTISGADDPLRFAVGSSGSFTVTSSDSSANLTVDGDLPSGVSFHDNGDGTASISGTPADGTGGFYTLVVKASDSSSSAPDGYAFASVQVLGAPTITSPSDASFAVGTAGSFSVTASGLPRSTFTESGDLPSGLSFTDSGLGTATISGTPDAGSAGTYHVTVDAENLLNIGHPVSQDLTITVLQAPLVTSDTSLFLGSGASRSVTVETSGYPAPALTESGSLPDGVSFHDNGDGTATLSGTPTDETLSTYPITIQASSTAGTSTQSAIVDAGPTPSFTSADTATFTSGQAGSFTVSAAGSLSTAPALAVTGSQSLPDGLSLTDNGDGTATISGTPTGSGSATLVTIAATDALGETDQSLTVEVDAAPAFDSGSDTSALFETAGRFGGSTQTWTVGTTGYPSASLSLSGALPDGVSFTDNGDGTATISGDPSNGTSGTYPLVVHLSNDLGTSTQSLSLEVTATALITSVSQVTWVAGLPNTFEVTTDGDPAAADISVRGTPPPDWMSFTQTSEQEADGTATISGTPPLDAVGDDELVNLFSQNGVPNGDTQLLDVHVASVGFTSHTPPDGTVGSTYAYQFQTVGAGGAAVTFAVQDGDIVPGGLTLSSSGELSGTPTTVGSFTFDVVATANDDSATVRVTVDVAPADHELEVTEFRLYGASGRSDWYARVTNTTSSTVNLYGWSLATPRRGGGDDATIGLYPGTLAPGASVLVSGPFYSRSDTPDHVGLPSVALPGGFQVIAPDGTVTDRVGELGAPAGFTAGTPLAAETPTVDQDAYVRRTVGGVPVDTGDNAHDFEFEYLPTSTDTGGTGTTTGGGGTTSTTTGGGTPATTTTATSTKAAGTETTLATASKPATTEAGSLAVGTGDNAVKVTWSDGAFKAPVTVTAAEVALPTTTGVAFSVGTKVIQLTVASGAASVTQFSAPVELEFPDAPAGQVPAYSHDGTTWTEIPKIPSPPTLPTGWTDGWYTDSSGTLHVVTLHATYFGVLKQGSRVTAAFRLTASAVKKLNLNVAHAVALHYRTTLPATLVVTLERKGAKLGSWKLKANGSPQTATIAIPKKGRSAGAVRLVVTGQAAGEQATRSLALTLTAPKRRR